MHPKSRLLTPAEKRLLRLVARSELQGVPATVPVVASRIVFNLMRRGSVVAAIGDDKTLPYRCRFPWRTLLVARSEEVMRRNGILCDLQPNIDLYRRTDRDLRRWRRTLVKIDRIGEQLSSSGPDRVD